MNSRKSVLVIAAALLAGIALGQTAWATGVDTSSPLLPPDVGAYRTAQQVYATHTGGALFIVLQDIVHQPLANTTIRSALGLNEFETFDSTVSGNATINGSPLMPVQMAGPVSVEVFGKVGNLTGTFQTEMLSMDLTGGGLLIRESPTLASTGQTSITDIGGGMYHIDSFFDVFTELSLDGGASWIPSDGPSHVEITPEPASLMLLGLGGLFLRHRRRA